MLSKRLKILRENCGYTQQQIADALNIDRSTYTYYETGKTSPDIHAIVKLAKIFNVSYSDILDDETPNSSVRDPLMKSMGRYGGKNAYNIYELSKQEKRLIIYFRCFLPKRAINSSISPTTFWATIKNAKRVQMHKKEMQPASRIIPPTKRIKGLNAKKASPYFAPPNRLHNFMQSIKAYKGRLPILEGGPCVFIP